MSHIAKLSHTASFPKPEVLLIEDHKRILLQLRKYGECSRLELSNRLEINNGVITRYTRELLSLGFVSEGEQVKASGRGRPSLPLTLNRTGAYAIGMTVHPGWIDLALVNLAGRPMSQLSFEYQASTPQAFAQEVRRHMGKLTGAFNLFRSKFLGFGMSVPGFAQRITAKRHVVDCLRDWRGLDLSQVFADELGGPVWIDNDANAAILAEYYADGQSDSDNLILLYLSFGVGGACMVNGRLFRGAFLNAGEVGAMFPLDEPRPSAIDLLYSLQREIGEEISLFSLQDDAPAPEVEALTHVWIERAAGQLYRAALSGVCWFDPEEIVLCGILPNWIVLALSDKLQNFDWAQVLGDRPRPSIRASQSGHTASAIGAAILPIHETLSPVHME